MKLPIRKACATIANARSAVQRRVSLRGISSRTVEETFARLVNLASAMDDQVVDQLFADNKRTYGGVRNDYFAPAYLVPEHNTDIEMALLQSTFGGNDMALTHSILIKPPAICIFII